MARSAGAARVLVGTRLTAAETRLDSIWAVRVYEPPQRRRGRFAVRGVRGVFLDIVKIGRDAWAAVRKTCAVAMRINQAATVASLGRWRNVVCKSRL